MMRQTRWRSWALAIPIAVMLPGAGLAGPRSLCRADERPLFDCLVGRKVASVCTSGPRTIYRYGARGRVEIRIASAGGDGRAYRSSVIGQGDGRQDSVRFRRGPYSYVVSAGRAGSLSDSPGAPLNAVTVLKDGATLSSRICRAAGASHLRDAPVPEDPDPDFVAWY